MKPTVNRSVIYTSLGSADGKYPPEQQAAIITRVMPIGSITFRIDDPCSYAVSLAVIYPTGMFFLDPPEGVPFSEEFTRGCWSWAPRV
ncbi:MAG: hypothetical protein A2Y38_11325 [Spirochaetes bacterium GWB1_59_5]|nr:MAG: hypothetical protein A2Y38_11325 [Spirochaetes bacterium GWB1_59_5]